MEILAIKVFSLNEDCVTLLMTDQTRTQTKKFHFFFSFFWFLSDLNCSIRRRFIYVLVKIPHYDSAKNRKFGTTIHAQPLIQKFLKFHSVM
jgi:hypothetical protein